MENKDAIPYGIRNNKVVHITELYDENKGKKCNCICPNCGDKLIAKMGKIRIKHFAHLTKNCNSSIAIETALHKLSKEILLESKKIKLPEVSFFFDDYCIYNNDYVVRSGMKKEILSKELYIEILDVVLEKRIDDIIPDVIIKTTGGKEILVEIGVTHFVDEQKEIKIRNKNLPTIEIDLYEFYNRSEYNREELKKFLIEDSNSKYWIYNEKLAIAENKVKKQIEEKRKLLEDKVSEIRLEKESREKEKQKKIEYAKRMSELNKPNKKMRIASTINNYTEYEYGKKYISEMKNSQMYRELINKMNIKEDNIPFIFNIPLPGEYAFNCNRILWQMAIYKKFIFKRKGKMICLLNVLNWVNKFSELPINYYFKYKEEIIKRLRIPAIYDTVKGYLEYLMKIGIISKLGSNENILFTEDFLILDFNNTDVFAKHVKYIQSKKDLIFNCVNCGEITNDIIVYIDEKKGICKSCILDFIKEIEV